jgi:hypothetical protein
MTTPSLFSYFIIMFFFSFFKSPRADMGKSGLPLSGGRISFARAYGASVHFSAEEH